MKLIYLYHSGFALLGEGYTLIFDYFEDSVSADKGIVHEQLLSREGRLYVFSSHAHADHFNRQIKKCLETYFFTVYKSFCQ
jgi:L-ascorbate metabolism protein UlaG (beta-lactamase superfamily)